MFQFQELAAPRIGSYPMFATPYELGASTYAEFVTHTDEFIPRGEIRFLEAPFASLTQQ